jgi:hypothetical protein
VSIFARRRLLNIEFNMISFTLFPLHYMKSIIIWVCSYSMQHPVAECTGMFILIKGLNNLGVSQPASEVN